MPAQITLTTTAGGPQGILRNYWRQTLLDILENNLVASDLAEQQVIPANAGQVIEFHRINSFPKQILGVSQFLGYMTVGDLKGQSFTVDSVVYGLELLTNDLRLTEKTIMTAEPNPIPTLTERFLYNAKDTLDQRMINKMVNNTGNTQSSTAPSVTYFGASVSVSSTWGDGSQTLTEATLDANIPSHRVAAESFNTIYTRMRGRSAKPRKGKNYYDVLVSPEIAGDLRTDATFQDIALKGFQRGEDKFEKAAVGNVFGCLIIEDENVGIGVAGTVNASTDQIYRCPAVADGYVARISHAKGIGVPQVNFIPPGKADKADPYGLVGILTWKFYDADGGIINPLAGEILRVASTRLKSVAQTDDSTWNA
jgi:N4-gp56 family major capsid protein